MADAPFLGIRDVAALLQISVPRAYELAAEKAIPTVRFGGRIRVPRAAFDQWLAEKSTAAIANTKPEPASKPARPPRRRRRR